MKALTMLIFQWGNWLARSQRYLGDSPTSSAFLPLPGLPYAAPEFARSSVGALLVRDDLCITAIRELDKILLINRHLFWSFSSA